MLDRVILRFSGDNAYRDFLGQEGPGSRPFPFITHLAVNDRDETIVLRDPLGGV